MKKLLNALMVVLICLAVLCGCSNPEKLAGVYAANEVSAPNDFIILYKDGTCSYFGDRDTVWEASGDTVTVIKQDPDKYYIDLALDSALTAAEVRSITTICNRVETVYSSEYLAILDKIRVEIVSKNDAEQTQKELSAINGVVKTEFKVLQGAVHRYTFTVLDGCLVSSDGSVYIKQGN